MKNFSNYIFSIFITTIIFFLGLSSGVIFNDELKELCIQNANCKTVLNKYGLVDNTKSKSNTIIEILGDKDKFKGEINFDKFWKVYGIIKRKAVEGDKLNDTKHVEESVISGLVKSLDDPYSLYMTEKENQIFHEDLAGNFEGIGAELQVKDELITVVSPLKESPAIKAGIMPQDIIIKVDGTDIIGWSLSDVIKKIRGPKGTDVKLTISRKGEEQKEFTIKRDVIHVASVKYEIKNDNIGYISVNQFGDSTVKEFMESIEQAEKDNIKGVVMDLRFNGGGYLDASIVLSSPFLNEGDLVTSIKSKDGVDEKKAIKVNSKLKTLPLVVLINQGSASASEIVSGALRDNKKGILLGETSFGKGTVQELVNLSGNSSLRITTAKWFTPNGQNIHKVGITPDVIIPRSFEQIKDQKDPQLDKAIEIINEGNFDKYFTEKSSLTGSAVIEFNGSGAIVEKVSTGNITNLLNGSGESLGN